MPSGRKVRAGSGGPRALQAAWSVLCPPTPSQAQPGSDPGEDPHTAGLPQVCHLCSGQVRTLGPWLPRLSCLQRLGDSRRLAGVCGHERVPAAPPGAEPGAPLIPTLIPSSAFLRTGPSSRTPCRGRFIRFVPVGSLLPLCPLRSPPAARESGSVASHGAWDSGGARQTRSYSRLEPTLPPN